MGKLTDDMILLGKEIDALHSARHTFLDDFNRSVNRCVFEIKANMVEMEDASRNIRAEMAK